MNKKGSTPEEKSDHWVSKKYGSAHITNPQVIRKINPSDLPVITINCAGNTTHIRNALITYCQRELGPISKVIDGGYQENTTIEYNPESLSKERDPLGLQKVRLVNQMKQADLDNLAYVKSKARLYCVLSSVTTKEVGEKLSVYRSLIKVDTKLPNSTLTATSTQPSDDQAFFNCPLNLWKDIAHVVTTKSAGNRRIDQEKVTVDFVTMRQRTNETLADFHHRMSHTVEISGLHTSPIETVTTQITLNLRFMHPEEKEVK